MGGPPDKPKKCLYYNKEMQTSMYEKAKPLVVDVVKTYNKGRRKGRILKAIAYGSIINKEMGIYYKRYKKIRYGSDVDVLCVAEQEFKPPKSWKYIRSFRDFLDIYAVGSLDKFIPGILIRKDMPTHPINMVVVNESKHNVKEAKKYTPLDASYSRKKGYKFQTWYKIK